MRHKYTNTQIGDIPFLFSPPILPAGICFRMGMGMGLGEDLADDAVAVAAERWCASIFFFPPKK